MHVPDRTGRTRKTFRRVLVPLILLLIAWADARPAAAEQRVALVIGNADYGAMGSLRNPVNDSRLIAGTLRDLGFRVIELENADQQAMKRGVRDFGRWLRRAGPDGVALFYYAGHSVQVSGRNYLLPVEAQILAEGDVDIEAVAADSVLAQMQHANTGVNIVILDACRNNPFQKGFRSLSSGLARMEAPTGTYIAYATAPGQLAMDGDGPHSPFTRYLASSIREPGLSIEETFKRVRQQVAAFSQERQIPWSSSSLIGDFAFNPGGKRAPEPAARAETPAPPATGSGQAELLYWDSIKDSGDPALFRDYQRRFPDGIFSAIAAARVKELEAPEAPRGEARLNRPPATPPPAAPQPSAPVRAADCTGLLRKTGTGDAPPFCLQILRGGSFEVSEKCGAISTRGLSDNRGRERSVRLSENAMVAVSETRIIHFWGEETRCYWIAESAADGISGYDGWVVVIPDNEHRFVRLHEAN